MYPTEPRKYCIPFLILLLLTAAPTDAQQAVRQTTWTLQDADHGLRQEVAQQVIERADQWLTRDDPNASIARLDDRVRITVLDEVDPYTGQTRSRLAQVVVGAIVIEEGFDEFLDSAFIGELVRRNYYWREESVVEFADGFEPPAIRLDAPLPPVEPPTLATMPRFRFSLDEISLAITAGIRAFVLLGFEEMGLPGTSYGRLRAGASSAGVMLWAELPLPIASPSTPLLPRTLGASLGAGMAFESGPFAAALAWSDASRTLETDTSGPKFPIALARAAMFTWRFSLIDLIGREGFSLRAGATYQEFVENDGGRGPTSIDVPRVVLRAEYVVARNGLPPVRRATLGLIGSSLTVSWYEQFTPWFGVSLTGALHGALGERPHYLPEYTFLITPTISLW